MASYTEEDKKDIWNSVIADMISGKSLRSILADETMPSYATFYDWMSEDEVRLKQYARAASIRADIIFDEIKDISDSTDDDEITLDDGKVVTNHHVINRDRLRVDSRKWMLSKMNPKKYGDKIEVDNKSTDGSMTPPSFIFKNLNESDE